MLIAFAAGEWLVHPTWPLERQLGYRPAVELAVVALPQAPVEVDRDPAAAERDLDGLDSAAQVGGKTAATSSDRLRTPSSAARTRPREDSRPPSQPVATPASLSSVHEWVSKISSTPNHTAIA